MRITKPGWTASLAGPDYRDQIGAMLLSLSINGETNGFARGPPGGDSNQTFVAL